MRGPVDVAARLCIVLALWLAPTGALAGASEKAGARRAEAEALVKGVIGGANPNAAANRLRYLGQEGWAAFELGEALRRAADERTRRNIVQALSLLGSKAAEPGLLSALGDEDGATRMVAVQGLGRLRSRAVDRIRPLLADPTLGVRREAARALGAARLPKLGRVLVAAARGEGEPEPRAAMLIAAGQSGDARQARALEAFLEHSSESTRFAAAQALCLLGAPKGLAFARERLASADRLERMQGLALLEGAKAKHAAPLLTARLKDPDRAVAARAARLLYEGGDASKLAWLVLASHRAQGEEKLAYEAELEALRLADDQRQAILRRAGER